MSTEDRRRGNARVLALAFAFACLLALLVGVRGQAVAARDGEAEQGIPDPQVEALERLRRGAKGPTDTTFVNGFPRLVETSVVVPGDSPAERATEYLLRYRKLYGQFMAAPFHRTPVDVNNLPDADPDDRRRDYLREIRSFQGKRSSTSDLDLGIRATSGPDDQVVAFRQTYKGLPVVGADLIVFLDGRRVTATVGGLLSDLDLSVRPELTDAEAEDAARRALELDGRDVAPALARTHLVVFAPELLPGDSPTRSSAPRLAWQVALGGAQPAQAVIDASSGQLYSLSPGINTHDGFDDYSLDLEDANGNNASNSDCYWDTSDDDTLGDEDGLNSDGQADSEAVELFGLSKDSYKFFHDKFNRHSYDGDGGQFELYVHAGVPNAGWTGGSTDCDLIEFANGFVAFDVLVHELTHGLGDFAAFGGPIYQGQSGALDESHADTLAARADGNWQVGEGIPGGAIRDMSDPTLFLMPDQMSEFVNTSSDNGGVHTNSSIPNKAAFLIADGGTHPGTNVQVSGIGKGAMGWLTYMSLVMMQPNASFLDNRGLMVAFADSAYSDQTTCQVRNAYYAVELGNPDIGCDGDEDDPDFDDDDVPFGLDNCPGTANPSQKDTDGDGNGDTCDGDSDEDGVPDLGGPGQLPDNCPGVPNADQTDANFNGVGAACDPTEDGDYDDDEVDNEDDNCPFDSNEDQDDVDSDGAGDACDPDTDGDGFSNDNDNAPFESNPGQEDTDGDGIGDVSDDCPETADENVAWTTGIPDLGVPPQPLQPDSDEDGIPDACDDDLLVNGRFTAAGNGLRPSADPRKVKVRGRAGAYVKVPVAASRGPGVDDWFRQGERRALDILDLDRRVRAWITDDDGRTVAEAGPQTSKRRRLAFTPLAGHRYFLTLYFSERYEAAAGETFRARMTADTARVSWPDPPKAALRERP